MVKKSNNLSPEFVPSSGKRIISDVIITPKQEITSQIFREPQASIRSPRAVNKRKWSKTMFIICAILVFWAVSAVLASKVEITIYPKEDAFVVDQTLSLGKIGSRGDMVFRTISVPVSQTGTFNATEKRTLNNKATGVVTIFNKGTDPQVLIASTRLQSSGGKIFRIQSTVVVPAEKNPGGNSTLGSISVTAIADQSGPEYNIGLSDFTVPGLNGSPKFNLVFARSKTEMQGGASGEQVVVGKTDISTAETFLVGAVQAGASDAVTAKLPQDEFLLKPSLNFGVLKGTPTPKAGDMASSFTFELNGEYSAATVDKKELEKILLKNKTDNPDTRVVNLDQLSVKLSGYKFDADSFKLQISGTAKAVESVNTNDIKNAVKERGLYDAPSVLTAFSRLSRVDVRFKPFWTGFLNAVLRLPPRRIDIILQGS